MKDIRSMRLLSNKARTRTGKPKVSSAHSQETALAVAVHLGLLSSEGLPGLIHYALRNRLKSLLRSNHIGWVRPKKSTLEGNHLNRMVRQELDRAWAEVIGPLYAQRPGFSAKRDLKKRAVARWVKASIEDPGSLLNQKLKALGYRELPELKRGLDWWEDRLGD